jgi:hypothetical protein
MVMDYQGNSRKSKEEKEAPPKKEVEKVVVNEVVVKRKGVGAKFRDIFVEADFRSVTNYIIYEVLVPAAKNTITDVASKGIERLMYGESAIRRRDIGASSRVTYSTPVRRTEYANYRDRETNPPRGRVPASNRVLHAQKPPGEELIIATREEALHILERMNDIIDSYEVASVADLKSLAGLETTFVDNNWGWIYLGDVPIQQIREGFLLSLPAAEPIK